MRMRWKLNRNVEYLEPVHTFIFRRDYKMRNSLPVNLGFSR